MGEKWDIMEDFFLIFPGIEVISGDMIAGQGFLYMTVLRLCANTPWEQRTVCGLYIQ